MQTGFIVAVTYRSGRWVADHRPTMRERGRSAAESFPSQIFCDRSDLRWSEAVALDKILRTKRAVRIEE